MYTPERYKGHDLNQTIAFMRKYNFATIISQVNARPFASHLPFVVTRNGNNIGNIEAEETIKLSAHFAKNNLQHSYIESGQALVIFTEPHAYISPKHYNKKQNVPTWNYIAVHAYGQVKLIHDERKVFLMLEEMMDYLEPSYKAQWNDLDNKYKDAMVKGIVAFEMEIEELQFKKKLSQNKKVEERERIINHLAKSEDSNEKMIADYMQEIEKDD